MTRDDAKIERARQLREWAEGPNGLFEIMLAVKRNYEREWTESDITDTTLREAIYHRLRALNDVRTAMEVVLADGRGAEAMQKKTLNRD